MNRTPDTPRDTSLTGLLLPALAALFASYLAISLVVWLGGAATTLLTSGDLPHASLRQAPEITRRLAGNVAEPASAWPRADRAAMPGGLGWWLVAALPMLTTSLVVILLAATVVRIVRTDATGRVVGRPPWLQHHLTGRPRRLRFFRPPPDRLVLGRASAGVVCTEPGTHLCLVAPTGQHKTTGIVIPGLLEWHGPCVCLSTKPDVATTTRTAREHLGGQVWIFDPFGPESASWSPLDGCHDWQTALLRADALCQAARGDHHHAAAEWWDSVATDLIAALLHAAALEGLSMHHIYTWITQHDTRTPRAHLGHHAAATAALDELDAVRSRDERTRSTTWLSTSQLLKAYRHPQVIARSSPGDLTAERFLDGHPNTLYVVASDQHQHLLRPLLVALVHSIYTTAFENGRYQPLDPPLLMVLDECANIAPLRDLPAYLSQSRAAGITFLTVWQDLAQMRARYQDNAGSILSNSLAKLFLGATSDPHTLTYLHDLLTRNHPTREHSNEFDPRRLNGHGLALYRDHPAFLVTPRPWYANHRLRRLANHRSVAA